MDPLTVGLAIAGAKKLLETVEKVNEKTRDTEEIAEARIEQFKLIMQLIKGSESLRLLPNKNRILGFFLFYFSHHFLKFFFLFKFLIFKIKFKI